MRDKLIVLEQTDHVVSLLLNSPPKGNPLDEELAVALEAACTTLSHQPEVWAIVLGSRGDTFCSGGEIPGAAAVERVAALDPPVIAAINGDALGLGLALALACDLRIAAQGARLGVPQFPAHPAGLTQRLPRLIGRGKALELLLLGTTLSATEAAQCHLVNAVAPPAGALAQAQDWAQRIAAKGPIAARWAKEALSKGMDLTLPQGLRLEADLYFLLHTTADRREGITAFLEKRKPQFRGE